jgi:hypothetical protein
VLIGTNLFVRAKRVYRRSDIDFNDMIDPVVHLAAV